MKASMLTKTIDLQNRIEVNRGDLNIGVLSDTHGVVRENVKQSLKDCQVILHAGDVCGQNVLDELGEITQHVIAVGGNNDSQFTYIEKTLPDVADIKLPGGKISLLHGHQFGMSTPSHTDMRRAFADSAVIVYGHSHKQIHEATRTPWMLNPGAAGETRTNGGASCAVITITTESWQVRLHRSSCSP